MPARNTPEFMTLVAVAVGLAVAITVSVVRRRRASAVMPDSSASRQ